MAFDVRTGKKLWIVPHHPAQRRAGLRDVAERLGGLHRQRRRVGTVLGRRRARATSTCTIESPTNDGYGGHRPGNNLYADSLVCLDIKTGKMRLAQAAHSPRHLGLRHAGRIRSCSTSTSTAGRSRRSCRWARWRSPTCSTAPTASRCGRSSRRRCRRPMCRANGPRRRSRFRSKPPAFDRQGITDDDLIDFTPELRAEALKAIEGYRIGSVFTRRRRWSARTATRARSSRPASAAAPTGNRRRGGSGNRASSTSARSPAPFVARPQQEHDPPDRPTVDADYADGRHAAARAGPADAQAAVRPHHRVRHEQGRDRLADCQRRHAGGDQEQSGAGGANIPKTGSPSQAGLLVTKTLLFAGEGSGGYPVFHAYDKATGAEIWQTPMPGAADQSADDLHVPGAAVHRVRRPRQRAAGQSVRGAARRVRDAGASRAAPDDDGTRTATRGELICEHFMR